MAYWSGARPAKAVCSKSSMSRCSCSGVTWSSGPHDNTPAQNFHCRSCEAMSAFVSSGSPRRTTGGFSVRGVIHASEVVDGGLPGSLAVWKNFYVHWHLPQLPRPCGGFQEPQGGVQPLYRSCKCWPSGQADSDYSRLARANGDAPVPLVFAVYDSSQQFAG